MTQVITFEGYTPTPRYDSVHWTKAHIQEAATATGTWAQIDEITLSPTDSDPTDPQSRNLTTSLASSTVGLWYRIIFVDGSGNTELPTDPVQNTAAGQLYITRDQLKDTLELDAETYADDDIDVACSAATQVIEGYKNTRYYPTAETRVYDSPDACDAFLRIDDLNSLTSLLVDVNGDGTFETTWTLGTDFYLGPVNADTDGVPFNRVVLRTLGGRTWPLYQRSIQVTASFGWAQTPNRVRQAATILAGRFLKRARETPYGLLTITGDAVLAARLGKIDPDVATLLDSERARQPRLIA